MCVKHSKSSSLNMAEYIYMYSVPELFLQCIIMHDSPVSRKCHYTMSICVHVYIHVRYISVSNPGFKTSTVRWVQLAKTCSQVAQSLAVSHDPCHLNSTPSLRLSCGGL